MEKINFDVHAEEYNDIIEKDLELFGEKNSYFAEYKSKVVKEILNYEPSSILDYGCGIGRNVKYFHDFFTDAEVYGCDISEKSLEIAYNINPQAKFFEINDEEIEKHKGKFELIFVSCVFHHIQPALRNKSIDNIYKLLKNKGTLVVFEHNPYNPVTRHFVNNCVFDEDAILLKPKESLELIKTAGLITQKKNYTLFFPAFLKGLRFLEKYLGFIPIGGQYYVLAIK
ncbi:class I SAM-dependent methyltransferase [Bacteroidota bacterium]